MIIFVNNPKAISILKKYFKENFNKDIIIIVKGKIQ